jgi:hypothetical protein
MIRAEKLGDIDDDEENILVTKIRLTKNEYGARVRNKRESNCLKTRSRQMNDENVMNTSKLRTTMHDLKQESNDNQTVVGNVDDYFINRKVKYFSFLFLKQ